METLVNVVHIIAAVVLIGVVLLQSGKGADMGAAFGGGGSTVFGPSGPGNMLTRLTTIMAIVFMATSLTLAVMSAQRTSVFDDVEEPATLTVPATEPLATEPLATEPVATEPVATEPVATEPAAEPAAAEE
ncbi:MAG: preprotein translocase subunit SecG [Proteobacteria bacterium]|nr:preprotein translocase subunit SecG [Pseudomonadota bacterium]